MTILMMLGDLRGDSRVESLFKCKFCTVVQLLT